MFINLTNHPSSAWGKEQLQAAHRYGNIVDMPFPNIPPQWSSEQVGQTAAEYFGHIRALIPAPQPTDVVHLMGEQVFCFKLLCLLADTGYTVVASTTERINNVLPNGNVEKEFIFVQFRKY